MKRMERLLLNIGDESEAVRAVMASEILKTGSADIAGAEAQLAPRLQQESNADTRATVALILLLENCQVEEASAVVGERLRGSYKWRKMVMPILHSRSDVPNIDLCGVLASMLEDHKFFCWGGEADFGADIIAKNSDSSRYADRLFVGLCNYSHAVPVAAIAKAIAKLGFEAQTAVNALAGVVARKNRTPKGKEVYRSSQHAAGLLNHFGYKDRIRVEEYVNETTARPTTKFYSNCVGIIETAWPRGAAC